MDKYNSFEDLKRRIQDAPTFDPSYLDNPEDQEAVALSTVDSLGVKNVEIFELPEVVRPKNLNDEIIEDSLYFEYVYCTDIINNIFSGLKVQLDWRSSQITDEVNALRDELLYQLIPHSVEMRAALVKYFRLELYKRLMASLNWYMGEVCKAYNPAVSESNTFPELRDELRAFYDVFVGLSKVLFSFDPNLIGSQQVTYFIDNHYYHYERTIQGLFMCILNNMMYLLSYHQEFMNDVLWYLDFLDDQKMITSTAYQTLKDYLAGDTGQKEPLAEPIPA